MGDGKLIIIISMTVSGLMNDNDLHCALDSVAFAVSCLCYKATTAGITGHWSVVSGQGQASCC